MADLRHLFPMLIAAGSVLAAQQDCGFKGAPDAYLRASERARTAVAARVQGLERMLAVQGQGRRATVPAAELPRRNFIDEAIFGKLQQMKVPAAALATDEEFLRRVTLDLTGRLPAPDEIRAFVAEKSADKRERVIDRLLYSEGYVQKWTMWMGDLLQNTLTAANFSNNAEGRNRMHEWIYISVGLGKSLRDVLYEAVAMQGNTYDREIGGVNFAAKASTPGGPAQDTYDTMLVRTATAFLGMSHYDCLLCHDGRRHLDAVSAWGKGATRLEAQRMAAFFSRMRISGVTSNQADYYYNSRALTDAASGGYDLNTTYGNRTRRSAYTIDGKTVANLTPVYRDGTAAGTGGTWRQQFVTLAIQDPMFARNFANRLWRAMFNQGLAEPYDALDPLRLDPAAAAPEGWDYQASHPALLEQLATYLKAVDYDLRAFLRLLATSSAYQLSSRYSQEWKVDYAPLFARHYARRLEGEEVHDILLRATGATASYPVPGWGEPAHWAMELPEPAEPRSNGTALGFMNSFSRGNRDTVQRTQAGSILMELNRMNSAFVTDKMRVTASSVLNGLAKNPSNEAVADDLFLLFLGRAATDYERGVALKTLANSGTAAYPRTAAVEDLAWALANKVDFLFSY